MSHAIEIIFENDTFKDLIIKTFTMVDKFSLTESIIIVTITNVMLKESLVFGNVISSNLINNMTDNEKLVNLVKIHKNKVIKFIVQTYMLGKSLLHNRS
jgi:hypothetical protein